MVKFVFVAFNLFEVRHGNSMKLCSVVGILAIFKASAYLKHGKMILSKPLCIASN